MQQGEKLKSWARREKERNEHLLATAQLPLISSQLGWETGVQACRRGGGKHPNTNT